MHINHAIAILTYASKPATHQRLVCMLDSLVKSEYPGAVFIVDDGSPKIGYKWRRLADGCKYPVSCKPIRRKKNGGISKGKNTCLRILRDEKVDIGFLADDDLEFKPKWWEPYLDAHQNSKYHHFSWATRRGGEPYYTSLDYPLWKPHHLNGCFLTCTQKVINTVGGFPVTPLRWGWDHVNWTNRIIAAGLAPCYLDALESNNYIKLNQYSGESEISLEERQRGRDFHFPKLGEIYRELIE